MSVARPNLKEAGGKRTGQGADGGRHAARRLLSLLLANILLDDLDKEL